MKLIILDRDGVINYDSIHYIKCPDEWQPIPGSLRAIARLNRAGYQVVIATNQSGIARGMYNRATLQKIHAKMRREAALVQANIHKIFFCPHLPTTGCECRKPKPGLLLQIQKTYQINLRETYFIGDSLSDIEAARAAGCQPILVLTGKGKDCFEKQPNCFKTLPVVADLFNAVNYIFAKESIHE